MKKRLSKEEKELIKKENKEKELKEKENAKKRENIYKEMVKYEKAHKKEVKIAPKDSYISLQHINKIYSNRIQAVYDFNLEINKHDFIVFVGPSGCGKSTTLRMIAGLEDITSGDLYIDGVYANALEPKDRDISMVFQSYALYPHMTVYNNMAFGLKMRHVPIDEINERVNKAAKILEIEKYLDRKPRALSGGQCQRVALGRAIVRNSKVFLMDEPLSNLDAKLRVQMRSEIVKLHEELGATTIYVTHDQTEAMTMANRIVVLKDGYIQQVGTPKEIYNKPNNVFVATFIGSPAMNILSAKYENDTLYLNNGYTIDIKNKKGIIKQFYLNEIELLKNKKEDLTKWLDNEEEKILLKDNEYKKIKNELNSNLDQIELIESELNEEKTNKLLKEAIGKLDEENKLLEEDKKLIVRTFYEKRRIKEQISLRKKNIAFYEEKIKGFNFDLDRLKDSNYVNKKEEEKENYKARNLDLIDLVNTYKSKNILSNYPSIIDEFNKKSEQIDKKIKEIEEIINKGTNEVLFGIRPEDIGQKGFKNNIEYESSYFENKVTIAELLGNEYYIHALIGKDKLIAKVNANQDIKQNDSIYLSFDLNKFHLFDKESKKLIW